MNKIFFKKDTLIRKEHFWLLLLTLDWRRFLVSPKFIEVLKKVNWNTLEYLTNYFPDFNSWEIKNLVDLLVKKEVLVLKEDYKIFDIKFIENNFISNDTMSFPRTVYWEATQICNFKCVHCYSESNTKWFKWVEFAIIKNLIDEMVKNWVEFFNIGWWEPLMYDHIFEVIQYCSSKWLRIELTTNWSLLSDYSVKKLKHCWLKFIQISLDWATKNSFEEMRPWSNFELIKENIKKLVKNWFTVSVNTVLTKINHLEILDIINLSEKLGTSFYKVSPLM